jgi:hypothetical protein
MIGKKPGVVKSKKLLFWFDSKPPRVKPTCGAPGRYKRRVETRWEYGMMWPLENVRWQEMMAHEK